jgi:hypothetical protein
LFIELTPEFCPLPSLSGFLLVVRTGVVALFSGAGSPAVGQGLSLANSGTVSSCYALCLPCARFS